MEVAPHTTLLDALRDGLGMTGTKKGCNEGECASCAVLMDGVPVTSCLVLIGDAVGKSIVTIEGISEQSDGHCVQEAFVESGGTQCGYCTPGFVVSTVALLHENARPTTDEINFYLAGNICRCTGYNRITQAVHLASDRLEAAAQSGKEDR